MTEEVPTLRKTDGLDVDGQEEGPLEPGLLVVSSGGQPRWSILPLPAGGELDLGRDNLGAQVDDGRISRRHVRVCCQNGAFLAMDLGSLNGTAIDGQRALPNSYQPFVHCLRIGDTLLLPAVDINPLRANGVTVRDSLVLGPRLFHTYQRIARVGASSMTLHITGESGSGKEHAARAFHNASPANRGPFVAVNCATIPEGIAERLLFGAKRGAFSGVTADVDGYVQAADKGTLFLDEVAELHASVQAKLLRVLETREVLALGALRPQPVTLRVCSASHRSLQAEVAAGRLREDLYYRIGRPAERVPALRERREELPWLIEQELRSNHPSLRAHASLVEACLLRDWPGNVRELLIEIRSAAQEAAGRDSQRVKAEHLSPMAGRCVDGKPPAAPPPARQPSQKPVAATPPLGMEAADKPAASRLSRAQILTALIEAKGNVSAAARELGIQRTQLMRHIKYHGVEVARMRAVAKS